MAERPKLSDEDRENLVAYLDGELDDETAHALEVKLSLDPNARAEADSLRQVWELLDYLPRTDASPTFTHRTLERVAAVQTSRVSTTLATGRRHWRAGAAWAAAVAAAAAVGFGAARLLAPGSPPPVDPAAEEKQLVRDLRAVDNLHHYQHIDDIEFLRALDHPDLFGDESVGR